ncbi:MAG: hypothetical protein K8R40_11875 [Anaerolineaceae bacterium]|nr:hypothetical protein [Anaerolineaceae bacterium]
MTYPLSSEVVSGQPTAADHYNHLRTDALYLGNTPTESVNLSLLLSTYSDNLNLALLGTNRLRITAASTQPAAIMTAGKLLRAATNVDLSTAQAPSGGAALWYVFVQAEATDNTIHLVVNTSAAPTSTQRMIGSFYWDGSRIVPDSIILTRRSSIFSALQLSASAIAGGRLCLQSSTPFEPTDRTGLTVYYSPFVTGTLMLYAPGVDRWIPHEFTEVSITLPGTTNKNYDIFASFDGTAISISYAVWTSDTVRASALELQDGRTVLSSDKSCLYLGTCRVNASGVVSDTETERFVWNAFNQRSKLLTKSNTTSHTYQALAWRVWNNDASNKGSIVTGEQRVFCCQLHAAMKGSTAGRLAAAGLGVNSTTAAVKDLACYLNQHFHASLGYCGLTQLGLNEYSMLQKSENSYSVSYYSTALMAAWLC